MRALCAQGTALPNKRLKLAGAVALVESECLCAGARELSFNAAARGSPAA